MLESGGVSRSRNIGLCTASGEYVTFVDADDYVDFNYIKYLVDAINDTNSDMAICGHYNFNEAGIISHQVTELGTERVNPNYVLNCIVGNGQAFSSHKIESFLWGKLYRNEVLSNICFPEGKNYEDLYCIPTILERCNSVVLIQPALYYYRQTPKGITHTPSADNVQDFINAIEYSNVIIERNIPEISDILSVRRNEAYLYGYKMQVLHGTEDRTIKQRYYNVIKSTSCMRYTSGRHKIEALLIRIKAYDFAYTIIKRVKRSNK